MNTDAFGAFMTVTATVTFWLIFIYRRARNTLADTYFWWSFFIVLWAFGYGITLAGFYDYSTTLLWNKFCQAMACLIAPFFFKFSGAVANKSEENKKIFGIYLFLSLVNAAGLFFTDFYVKGLWSFGPYRYQPLGGAGYSLFTLVFFMITLHAFAVVAGSFKKSEGIQREQIKLFLWATILAYIGGGSLFLQGFGITFPSTGVFLIMVHTVIMGYLVFRYKFFDMDMLVDMIRREKLMTMGMLAASMNHEIRNPLYVIKSKAEIAVAQCAEYTVTDAKALLSFIEKMKEYFQTIVAQAQKALEIMNQFVSYAKHNLSDHPQKTSVELKSALENALRLIRYELNPVHIEFERNIPDDLPVILADKRHLEEILLNLILNACQAMEKGGKIIISASQEGKDIRIRIRDTGPGIAKKDASKIFEPFFSTKEHGSGLGLFIVRELTERNNGRILVSSEADRGAEFSILLQKG